MPRSLGVSHSISLGTSMWPKKKKKKINTHVMHLVTYYIQLSYEIRVENNKKTPMLKAEFL